MVVAAEWAAVAVAASVAAVAVAASVAVVAVAASAAVAVASSACPTKTKPAAKAQSEPADLSLRHAGATAPTKAAVVAKPAAVAAVVVDESVSPEVFWNQYFAEQRESAVVRQTARELMGKKKYDQVIAMIEAALRHGQSQSWMYESLGIAMELAGRSKTEIERTVMSAADFSSTPDELMYISEYMARIGLDRRAYQLCQQVIKIEPLRCEAYALGLKAAQKCDDLAGIEWATVGILEPGLAEK